jgi:hypothetical protein
MTLNQSKEPLSTTQISEKIAINSRGQLLKVSGALKDSLENRLKREGYVESIDISAKKGTKPIKKSLRVIYQVLIVASTALVFKYMLIN